MKRLFLLFVGSLVGTSSAWAQPAPDPAFDEGRARLERGDYAGACTKFQETWDASHTPGKAFNLSVCEEKQNHLRKAQSWMREGMLLLAKDDDRLSGAVERLQNLEKRLPYLKIVVGPAPDKEPVTSAVAAVDDQPVSTTEPVPVDPGHHVVKLSATGRASSTVELDLAEGERRDVALTPGALDAKPPPPTPPPPSKAKPQPPPSPPRGQFIAGLVLGGVGIATLGGALGMALLANSTHDDFLDAKSAGKPTDDIAERGRTVNIVEGTLLGIGGAALITGVIVALTAPRARPQEPAPIALVPQFGTNGGGAWLVGQF